MRKHISFGLLVSAIAATCLSVAVAGKATEKRLTDLRRRPSRGIPELGDDNGGPRSREEQ